ncbi:MAG TPA: hypothetical protein VFU96_00170 [Acidimicrobiia bacterium]|nr:hypothetical protein [Acidimicrobiia bacterium]
MRGPSVKWGVLVALIVVFLAPGVALAEQENYYLGPDGVPRAQLMLNPLGGEMPNYDRGRDVEPGLLLQRSTRGLAEDDAARFQHWQIDVSEQRLTGFPSMVVWSAADMFEAEKQGVFTVYLLDCDTKGVSCENLGSKAATVDTGAGGTWVETIVDFPALDHRFAEGRHLGVRIVVSSASEADLIFAYGYAAQRSRLTLHAEQPIRTLESTVTQTPLTAGAADFGAMVAATAATPEAPVAVAPAAEPGSFWPWLLTLVISTIGLVSVGALLLPSLTKPGRHEAPPEEPPSGRQTTRISVSAP